MLGVILGHLLLYEWLFPDPAHRHDELASTGHGYFPYLIVASLILGVFSTWVYFKQGKSGKAEKSTSVYALIAVLFLLQSLFFLFIETLERFFHGGSEQAFSFLTSSTLVFGVVFQFLVSCVVGVFITTTIAIGALFRVVTQSRPFVIHLATGYLSPYVVFAWLHQGFTRAPPAAH